MIYQKDRQYSLLIGKQAGVGVEINNLNISFSVTKSSDNKKKPNKANIDIYNLSHDYQTYFEENFIDVVLSVGYAETGMKRLFAGNATIVGTRKSGTDTVTSIQLDSLYSDLNFKTVSRSTPPGVSIRSVLDNLVKDMEGVNRLIASGENVKRTVVDGYPMFGSPRQILNELAEAYEIEWQVDDNVLYVMDGGKSYQEGTKQAFVISEVSGLIERPYYDNVEKRRRSKDKIKEARKGVKFKTLLNPSFVAGGLVKLDYSDFEGFYKIESLKHTGEYYGDVWETELICGTKIDD